MSRLKTIFSPHRNIPNLQSLRFFSSNRTVQLWEKMSVDQRINYALNEDNPELPEIAYFKGLGFLRLGREYTDQAVTAFKQAIELSGGNYWAATCKLADVYTTLGLEHKALQVFKEGSTSLNEAIKLNDRSLFDTIKEQLIVDTDNQKATKNVTHSIT